MNFDLEVSDRNGWKHKFLSWKLSEFLSFRFNLPSSIHVAQLL